MQSHYLGFITIRLAIVIVVLCLSTSCQRHLPVASEAPLDVDVERDVFGGKAIYQALINAKKATVHRTHYHSIEETIEDMYVLQSYDHDPPIDVSSAQLKQLKQILTQVDGYDWRTMNDCEPDYAIVFTFYADEGIVKVAFCFDCDLFGVFPGEDLATRSVNREDNFDPIHNDIGAIAKSLYPEDSVIQSLKLYRKGD